MIQITPTIALNKDEVQMNFVRASGPGGQNVNRVASAVQLRFDVENSTSLPEEVRVRLRKLARNRINDEGVLIIEAKRHRSQLRNRHDALEQLSELIQSAAKPSKSRRKTKPTAASKERRLERKKHRGRKKELRRRVDPQSE